MVTSNRRLSRQMTAEYTLRMADYGLAAWETPRILPYQAWLQDVYNDMLSSRAPADPAGFSDYLPQSRELWVWDAVIRESEYGRSLLRVKEAAEKSMEAWAVCQQWRLDFDRLMQTPAPDTEAFLDWAGRFADRLSIENWIEGARLPDTVAEGIRQGAAALPEQLILAGFDEFSPQLKDLISALCSSGSSVSVLEPPAFESRPVRCGFPDTDSEIAGAALWVRRMLEVFPGKRIGVIVPGLHAVREKLERIFDDILHPGHVLSTADIPERAYNISLGPCLSCYPLIRSALQIISLSGPSVSTDEAGKLLRSPFIAGSDQEFSPRALLDARLRKTGEAETDLDSLIWASGSRGCTELSRLLERFKETAAGLPERGSPSCWAENFGAMLDSIGWPGRRSMSSSEYQVFDAWHDALLKFASMDRVLGEVGLNRAKNVLKQILDDTPFQPETGDLPVQVMGVLESAGQAFDAAWIMGLHSENWPPPPSPNPLLPVRLQREYGVLHSSAERELEYAGNITRRLLGCAEEIVLSYPEREGDARLFPSPLIRDFPEKEPEKTEDPSLDFRRQIRSKASFETIEDIRAPEIPEGTQVQGGTGILKAQASCPFSAFAKYRLGAEPLEAPAPGLNALERGNLVHRALQLLWEKVLSRDVLVSMSRQELENEISRAVNEAVRGMKAAKPRTFTGRFTALEKERLESLLKEWIEEELKRSGFTVQGREVMLRAEISGLRLKVFADRIDALSDGRLVIIDYKTGSPGLADWFSERMREPQLPLYALSLEKAPAAVLFARVRKGECRFIGVAGDEGIAPGIKPLNRQGGYASGCSSFSELLDLWRGRLEGLAAELRSGFSEVRPADPGKDCRYCPLGLVCRISEKYMLEECVEGR